MRLRAALAAAFAVALIAAGCGGGGNDTASTPTATETQPQPSAELSSGKFNPEQIFKNASPGVVTVISIFGPSNNPLDILGGGGGGAGEGAGSVISDSGEIVTNAHVVTSGGESGNGKLVPAKEVYVEFADRNRLPAKIEGYDPFADVALLKIDPDGLDLHPLKLGDSSGLVTGQPVVAIGAPFGEALSLSTGVISALHRDVQSLTKFQIDDAIQTDASINPGNSGGPMLNANAEVIGINQQIESRSGSNSGVGFAVPVSAVKHSLEQLRDSGKVSYAFIGVTSQQLWPQLAKHLGLGTDTGALVAKVTGGGPAANAGIKGGNKEITFEGQPKIVTGGDVIVAVDGAKVIDPNDLSRIIATKHPGDTITVTVVRGGSKKDIKVKLGTRPLNPG